MKAKAGTCVKEGTSQETWMPAATKAACNSRNAIEEPCPNKYINKNTMGQVKSSNF